MAEGERQAKAAVDMLGGLAAANLSAPAPQPSFAVSAPKVGVPERGGATFPIDVDKVSQQHDSLWPAEAPRDSAPEGSRASALLRASLSQRGLLLGIEDYNRARRKVDGMGASALQELRRSLAAVGVDLSGVYREHDYERVLGFGAALTRYLVEPWLQHRTDDRAVLLGAMCNLIVSLFDHLLDTSRLDPRSILSREMVQQLAAGDSRWERAKGSECDRSASRLLRCLVALYFENLQALERGKPAHGYRRLLLRRIERMYMAEVQGIQQPRSRSSIGVQRVCATPFLVMALPCWLASHLRTDALSIEQVAWVLRFGRLIGWVDDFEDLAFDAVARQFNRLLEPRAALNLKELAECVADSVEALEALRMRRARSEDLWSRQLLRLLLTSWLGGPMRSEGARWDKEWG